MGVLAFYKGERGATMVEYAILVGVVALFAVTGVSLFGNALSAAFSKMATTIGAVTP
jgi:Flp pilus assembly pilin Flp